MAIEILQIDDTNLSLHQERLREQNHPSSAQSKAHRGTPAVDALISPGSLVYVKSEGDKFSPRDLYMVISISNGQANIQKFRGGSFMSKKYSVPLNKLYAMTPSSSTTPPLVNDEVNQNSDDKYDEDSSDDDFLSLQEATPEEQEESTDEEENPVIPNIVPLATRPVRERRRLPSRLR